MFGFQLFDTILLISLAILAISLLGSIYRIIKGPSPSDRIVALDTVGINMIAIVAVSSILLRTSAFLEVILLVGVLAFIGTVAFAKFIERGVVLDRDRDQ
ncbi:Na(+)/H(+) antiporter subunit F1 [Halalkalibacter urbisdiaboli]|uniref:Na(+)/H(+) antiporter subunit F1 n=1 Tax=Halalkalibacter urbisdiaboli TaxID=1960589 RepID=UPI000B43E196|nr:Na(+)/H(+) antiporter subunit F1 [Halalkalibacter urbisdiaboli]